MANLNFDDVLDTLSQYGIKISTRALDDISFYFCDHDYTAHRRNFQLFQEADGEYLVYIAGDWHTTDKVLS